MKIGFVVLRCTLFMSIVGFASAESIVYEVSGTTEFLGQPGLLTISGSFDWGSMSGLSDFDIVVAGYTSIALTNADGGKGDVDQPALQFVDYTADKSQTLTLSGILGGALPATLGTSVPLSGTYSYFFTGTPNGDVFTVQGSVTAESFVTPEPSPSFLLSVFLPLLFWWKLRRFATGNPKSC